jgi:tetratricopeptide (TPR) repeat protein
MINYKKNKKVFTPLNSLLIVMLTAVITFPAGGITAEDENTVLFRKAVSYFFQKKFDMAEMMLQEVIRKDPENALAYSYLGDIFVSRQRYDAAENVFSKALEIDPSISENYFRLGQIYYYKKMGAKSVEYFRRTLNSDPAMNICYYHIGLTYLMLERDKENTILNWETFLRAAPEDPQYENLKRVVELLKNPDFVIPPKGSDITVEEALLLGGAALKTREHPAPEKQADNESKKTIKNVEDILIDEEL